MYNIDGKDYKYHRFKRWYLNHTWKYRKRKDVIVSKALYYPIGKPKRKKQIIKWAYIRYKTHNVTILPKEVKVSFNYTHSHI